MKGKFPVLKLIGIIVAVIGIALGIVGVVVGNKKYSIKPSDARNSVVWIRESLTVPEPLATELKMGSKNERMWSGTGWAIGTPGSKVRYIITNGHVIEQAYAWPKGEDDPFDIEASNKFTLDEYLTKKYGMTVKDLKMKSEIRVYFSKDDYVVPEVVYYSGPSNKDIAILKLDESTNKRDALLIRNSDSVEVGEEVTALGFPGVSDNVQDPDTISHSIDDVTVTKGIVSKRVKPNGRDYDTFQMDVSINHGNSGGPLVDKDGYVVGINTLGNANDSNMNYAIVSNELKEILDENNIAYKTTALANPGYIVFVVIGVMLFIGGVVMIIIPTGKKKAPVAGAVGVQAGVQPGVNPYAAAARQPAAQGYPQQNYARPNYPQQQPVVQNNVAAAPAAAAATAAAAPAASPAQQPATAAPSQGTRPVLKGLKGQFVGKSFDLSRGAVVFGRDPASCNLVFNNYTKGISGKHCQLNYEAATGTFILTDLGSSYGTYTGSGKKLVPNAPERLAAGDTFYLADENVKFLISKE